jgi:hypothetical protein
MRYQLTVIPFMGHHHVTLKEWDYTGSRVPGQHFWDVGPDDVKHPEELWEVLSYIAGDIAASQG